MTTTRDREALENDDGGGDDADRLLRVSVSSCIAGRTSPLSHFRLARNSVAVDLFLIDLLTLSI